MYTRVIAIAALPVALLLLALSACDDAPSYGGYLEEEIPPCTPISGSSVDPCDPDANAMVDGAGGMASGSGLDFVDEPRSVRYFLDGGAIGFVPHIVLRGTYIPDTVRCTSNNPIIDPAFVEPGYYQHALTINCYADVRVNAYILGSGPPRLIVLVYFETYLDGMFEGEAANWDMTPKEFEEWIVTTTEEGVGWGFQYSGGIYSRGEVILFVGPPNSYSVEAWEVFATWNVRRQEDGTVVAVHPNKDAWKSLRPSDYRTHLSALEMELPRFAGEVAAAQQARLSEYGGRIAAEDIQSRAPGVELPMLITDVHSLDEFMKSTGVYDHPDGTPVPPPPVPG